MDQVKIDVVQAKTVKAALKSAFHIAQTLGIVPDLGGDKKLFARDTASGNTASYILFVLIRGSGVDHAVAAFHSGNNSVLRFVFSGGFIYAQTKQGHFSVVI